MIVVNRDMRLDTVQTPQFIFTDRDKDVQDLTLILSMVEGIKNWGRDGVKFLPQELSLLMVVLIEKSNTLIQKLENE